MPTNAHWNNLNERRSFPLDETASALPDADAHGNVGEPFGNGIVTDLRLVFPKPAGIYPFIGAYASTERAVTLLLQVAGTMANEGATHVLLASITILKSQLEEDRLYDLSPAMPGVAGFVAFGSEIGVLQSLRFSSPLQSLLCPYSVRRTTVPGVDWMRKAAAASKLTGIVRMRGTGSLEIVGGTRTVDDRQIDAAIIRLKDDLGSDADVSSVLRRFAGPCGARPDSRTCEDPQPVEYINRVGPNCDGEITLDFSGCAVVRKNVSDSTIVFDCEQTLETTCLEPDLPDEEGNLPGVYEPDASGGSTGDSDSIVLVGELPFLECFVIDGGHEFVADSGSWVENADVSPTSACGDGQSLSTENPAAWTVRNVNLWNGFDLSSYWRKVTVDFKLLDAGEDYRRNAGIVLNFRPHASLPSKNVYYLIEADYDGQRLRIAKFDGTSVIQRMAVSLSGSPLVLGDWYRLTATAIPQTSGKVAIWATIASLDDDSLAASLGPHQATDYGDDDGLLGVHANRANSRFSAFQVEIP